MKTLHEAIKLMKTTDQIPGRQTIWAHGISVRHHLLDLIKVLTNPQYSSLIKWQIPSSFQKINWQEYLYPVSTLARYALLHDMGKPLVWQQDKDG
jgi:hypothetical protein